MADVPATRVPALVGGLARRKVGVDVPDSKLGLSIPNLSIQHKVDREQAAKGLRPGTFNYRKKCIGEDVRVVFLKCNMVRQYDVREGKKVQTLCASSDGYRPIEEIAKPFSDSCLTCECSQWTGPEDDRHAPLCDQVYAFFGILLDHKELPFWFRSSTAKANRLAAETFLRDFRSDMDVTGLHQWVVRLSLKPDGQWYVPVYDVEDVLPYAQHEVLFEQVKDLLYVPFLGRDVVEQDESEAEPRDVTPPAGWQPPPPIADDDIPF